MNTKCVFLFSPQCLSETFIILRRIERDMIKKIYIGLHVKYSLLLSDLNETRIFLDKFSKNTQISNFMKIRSVGAESCSMRTDKRIDRHYEPYRKFANALKNRR